MGRVVKYSNKATVLGCCRALLITAICVMVTDASTESNVVYEFDFSNSSNLGIKPWMKENGLKLGQGLKASMLSLDDKGLHLETDKGGYGLVGKTMSITNARRIRIEWGVDKVPSGIDWGSKHKREPIGVTLRFGTEIVDYAWFRFAGMPYFMTLMVTDNAEINTPLKGNYYKQGGRYYCLANTSDSSGKTIVSEFDFSTEFKAAFNQSIVPAVTGIAVELDTRGTTGTSSAYIRRIQLLD